MTSLTFRDVEQISTYLDGQLPQVDATRLEARLKNDPELRIIFDELSQARTLMRKLPARRAPRNFTLTPKMAGIKPPLPRSFPIFRLASVLAAVLFFFAYAANISVPAMAAMRAAAPAQVFGKGGGGGGDGNPLALESAASAPAAQAPQAPVSPAQDALLTATPESSAVAPAQSAAIPAPTEMALAPGAQAKINPPAQNQAQASAQQVPIELPVSPFLLFGLLGFAVFSGASAYVVSLRNDLKWFGARSLPTNRASIRQILWIVLLALALIALVFSIYWLSTTTFYAPVAASAPLFSNKGPVSSGDKGGPAITGTQDFSLTPGLGYNFSTTSSSGLVTSIDFPADVFPSEMLVSFIPGLNNTPQGVVYFDSTAFSLVPADNTAVLQVPYSITLDYGKDVASNVDASKLILYWWSGSDWLDAAAGCSPPSSYERIPESYRIRVTVCQMGSFVLAAP